MGLQTTGDESVLDSKGKYLHFGFEKFCNDIMTGKCCFICGAPKGTKPFNDEHIIPDWVIRRYGIGANHIGTPYRDAQFGRYKVPCCEQCNSMMGTEVEDPISKLTLQNPATILRMPQNNDPMGLTVLNWLCLMFFKTHFRDRLIDHGLSSQHPKIGFSEYVDLRRLHIIHSLARQFYTENHLTNNILGSTWVFAPKKLDFLEGIDYSDFPNACSIMIRLDGICFISVLDDSWGVDGYFGGNLPPIHGPMSPLQLREFLARVSLISERMLQRPEFIVEKSHRIESVRYDMIRPKRFNLSDDRPDILGEYLVMLCKDILQPTPTETVEEQLTNISTGKCSFIWDSDGKFVHNSMDVKE